MFYSDTILARKGPLASIWLAAHWDRRLNKHQIMVTDVQESIQEVMSGSLPPMALRLSGQLLLGASKIYHRKARYLLDDCTDALSRLRLTATNTSKDVDMPAEQTRAASTQITINSKPAATVIDESFDLEDFLNEPINSQPIAADAKKAMKTAKPELDTPIQPMSFGGGAGDDLMDEFAGLMNGEVEVGRRQSDAPRTTDLSMMSPPDVGRLEFDDGGIEDELRSLKDSLPYSPLRTANGAGMMGAEGTPKRSPVPEKLFSSPPSSVKRRRGGNGEASKRRRRVTLLLDEETEMSNSQLQAQIADTESIVVGAIGSAAGAFSPSVNVSELLSRPGALLLPGGIATDLSGLFANTCALSPVRSLAASAFNRSSDRFVFNGDISNVYSDNIVHNDDAQMTAAQELGSLPEIPTSPFIDNQEESVKGAEDSFSEKKWANLFQAGGSVNLNSLVKVHVSHNYFVDQKGRNRSLLSDLGVGREGRHQARAVRPFRPNNPHQSLIVPIKSNFVPAPFTDL